MSTPAVKFNRLTEPHAYLSNFYAAAFTHLGVHYRTSEHYFQAHKFPHVPEYFDKIVAAASPAVAARLGRSRKQPLRQDWEQVKEDVMRVAVREKFRQNPELLQQLLDTGDAELIENRAADSYWGNGGDEGKGLNRLGFILMQVRQEFRDEQGDDEQ